jgi:rubrerythrin
MEINKIEEILDFAIDKEQEAHDFYTDLANKADRPGMKAIFTQFAGEEMGHKNKLMSIKQGKRLLPKAEKVMDLKIAEYVVDVDPGQELDYQKALILAMKREKAAFRLYTDIANQTDDNEMKLSFLALAQEEAKHKLRFELEYDEVILAEN